MSSTYWDSAEWTRIVSNKNAFIAGGRDYQTGWHVKASVFLISAFLELENAIDPGTTSNAESTKRSRHSRLARNNRLSTLKSRRNRPNQHPPPLPVRSNDRQAQSIKCLPTICPIVRMARWISIIRSHQRPRPLDLQPDLIIRSRHNPSLIVHDLPPHMPPFAPTRRNRIPIRYQPDGRALPRRRNLLRRHNLPIVTAHRFHTPRLVRHVPRQMQIRRRPQRLRPLRQIPPSLLHAQPRKLKSLHSHRPPI